MRENTNLAALLWDESYLWGIWLYDALLKTDISFKLIQSKDLKNIHKYKVLFVPGGWAKNKFQRIGTNGADLIKKFIKDGGIYFGICGGAGLATIEGIGIVNIKRKKDRVPGFSGPVKVAFYDHSLWINIKNPEFYLWWPSEFLVNDKNIKVLASFNDYCDGAFSSDIPASDFEGHWNELESIYGINLNPKKMKDAPIMIETEYGRGKVFLSLIHFDTPLNSDGLKVFKNIKSLFELSDFSHSNTFVDSINNKPGNTESLFHLIQHISEQIKTFILFGERNFLWFKRYPFMYQWRRGIRGFEYINLHYMIDRIFTEIKEHPLNYREFINSALTQISSELKSFLSESRELLVRERIALQKEKITYNLCNDYEINLLRDKLFGKTKSYGGRYKELIEKIDEILFLLLKSKLE